MFFSGENVFTAFISPIVPIEIKSSALALGESYFLAIYTTSLKLWVINSSLALLSPSVILCIISASSDFVRGGGRVSLPLI